MTKSTASKRNVEPPKSGGVVVKAKKSGVKLKPKKVLSRAKLVGKFPGIRHQPAPAAPHQIKDDDRRKLLSAMALV